MFHTQKQYNIIIPLYHVYRSYRQVGTRHIIKQDKCEVPIIYLTDAICSAHCTRRLLAATRRRDDGNLTRRQLWKISLGNLSFYTSRVTIIIMRSIIVCAAPGSWTSIMRRGEATGRRGRYMLQGVRWLEG